MPSTVWGCGILTFLPKPASCRFAFSLPLLTYLPSFLRDRPSVTIAQNKAASFPSAAELLGVHPEHGRSQQHIADELAKHGGDDSSLPFWQVSCSTSCVLRKAALRILSGEAAARGPAFVVGSSYRAHR
jgi:hypothetical protein